MLKRNAYLLLIVMISLLFISCEKKEHHEYETMHWDRDMCERCKMVISERKHAVQVINKKENKAYKFDDLGCAIEWFKEEKISWENNAGIWITDVETSKWIDAKKAFYDTSHKTPMGYGFSANENKESIQKGSEILDFNEVKKRILARGHHE